MKNDFSKPQYGSRTDHATQWAAALLVVVANTSPAAMDFTEVTAAANINHTFSYPQDPLPHGFSNQDHAWFSGGAVAEDFDGDGWVDLYVLQGGTVPNLLYMNQQDGTFLDEAATRGTDLTGAHFGASAADFDGDGDIDLFISSVSSPHILLLNDGSGVFSASPQVFNTSTSFATSPSWGDLNNDGLLDLAFGSWHALGLGDLDVYLNLGGGQFQHHQTLRMDWVFVPRFADVDGDGFQDLLVSADFGQARWFRNDGKGVLRPAGVSDVENGMGNAVGDIDNDGDLDWFMSSIRDLDAPEFNWGTTGNRLLLNDGSGTFSDITETSGVRDGYWGWGADFADFDNDGDLDLYQVNGWQVSEPIVAMQFNNTPACLFENLGGNSFQEIAGSSGDAANTEQGRCVVVFDYDNDGDDDIFIGNNLQLVDDGMTITRPPGSPVLLRNDTENRNDWLTVQLDGQTAPHHSHGIGARVYLRIGGVTQMRELHASSGFNGHGPGRIAQFGLGDNLLVDAVRAVWTNGDETELHDVAADQAITLASPQATVTQRTLNLGESVTAELAVGDLPAGATASWSSGGVPYTNPASITMSTPGTQALVLTILDSGGGFLRSESLQVTVVDPSVEGASVARQWNEQILNAIRIDHPDPTTHARNLFHSSVAMWDAWAAYDPQSIGLLHNEVGSGGDPEAARREAISYAAYRVLKARYEGSINASTSLASFSILMTELGYDPSITTTIGSSPAALGNRVAQAVLDFSATDGATDESGFLGGSYSSVNDFMVPSDSGTVLADPNRWQALLIVGAETQNGQADALLQTFLGSHWGGVRPFALGTLGASALHLDPGPPPQLGGTTDAAFKQGNVDTLSFSGLLDPADGNFIDISPAALGNSTLGSNDGTGYTVNPATGQPYAANIVNHADFGRVLAEFWADGPESETPPGHWNVLINEVSDTPGFERRFEGSGPILDSLEWDVKAYFVLNGALHDSAVAAWGIKRVYDFVRPVSSIRYMGGLGQSSDSGAPSYDAGGLPLVPDLIEVVSALSSAPGQRHAHLSANIGEVTIRTWSAGAGVSWILAVDWMPYQRASFVTPAFAGYISGHSTFSRAAAEVLTRFTGDAYFPGGLGTFTAKQDAYLHFETGPTTDVTLQWATYFDAADQAGLSRLYGGIHVPADDGPGRIIGSQCGISAWDLAIKYFDGSIANEAMAATFQTDESGDLSLQWSATRGAFYQVQQSENLSDGFPEWGDWIQAGETRESLAIPNQPVGAPRKFFRVLRSHEGP